MKINETMKIESEDKSVYVVLYELYDSERAIVCTDRSEIIVSSCEDAIYSFLEIANERVNYYDLKFNFTTSYEIEEVRNWFGERMAQNEELVGDRLALILGMKNRYKLAFIDYLVDCEDLGTHHPQIKKINPYLWFNTKEAALEQFDEVKHKFNYNNNGLCVLDENDKIIDEWNVYREGMATNRIARN